MGKKKKKPIKKEGSDEIQSGAVAENRKARYSYEILETFEAGMVLTGNEIKSIRAGHITLNEAFVRPRGNELFLLQAHITQYSHSSIKDYDPVRPRKLLMHKHEINRLQGKVEEKGLTIVPLKIYITKRGFAKVLIGLARGKDAPDKKHSIMDREKKREAERAMKGKFD